MELCALRYVRALANSEAVLTWREEKLSLSRGGLNSFNEDMLDQLPVDLEMRISSNFLVSEFVGLRHNNTQIVYSIMSDQ